MLASGGRYHRWTLSWETNQTMASFEERRRRGSEIVKKYKPSCANDAYAAATDAIADILLAIAEGEDEARQVLSAAEIDYRSALEGESFAGEG
jgi:hypothetical protein